MCYEKEFFKSKRQEQYFLYVLPKLDKEIANMDLGMRANTCLVSAGITTISRLKEAISKNEFIPYLDKVSKEEIIKKLK